MKKVFLISFLFVSSTYAQISGCTDPLSLNFNPKASTNDGSCQYAFAKIKPESSNNLNSGLSETSGLLAFDNLFWTHNDNQDKNLYGLTNLGLIQKKISLEKVVNTEWEDISQDSAYIYIGDFGNNFKGNRSDLHILKIEKKSLFSNNPVIDTISFSYSNQTDFSQKKSNSTDFDCEAFVVSQDTIYLFTKQWNQKKTAVYTLPKTPGKYVAQLKETLNVDGLITGATFLPSKKTIVLSGYSRMLQPFFYLIYDYKNFNFAKANKRKIKVAMPFHQIEGITTENGTLFYFTNESLFRKPFLNVSQKINMVNLSSYLKS